MFRPLHLLALLFASATFAQVEPIDPIAPADAVPAITGALDQGEFILAPNPASDEVRIIPVQDPQQRLYALFYDEGGNNQLSIEITGPTVVQLEHLTSGTYMVTTVNSRGTPLSAHRLRISR